MSKQNSLIEYLHSRIKKDDYRGIHLSQHNRLPFNKVSDILKKIYQIAGEKQFNIHIGDDNGTKQKEAHLYYKIVEELNKEIGQVTINSLKKNIFPDLQTMGFLNRFDGKNQLIDRTKRSTVHAVQLSPLGVQYAQENNPKEQYRMYITATEKILQPIIDDLFYVLYKEFESISVWEFMFIFSDTDLALTDKINLIQKSRQLTHLEHVKLKNEIQEKFDSINQSASNKTQKRDFNNWYNEALQIFNLLNQTIYFKTFRKTVLMLALSQEALEFRATRSQNEKIKCLQWHEVDMKKENYELHHIYPLDYAYSKKDLDLIDDYRNLIYISKEKHKQIPAKNNLYIKIIYEYQQLKLLNVFNENDTIILTPDVFVKQDNLSTMIEYNQRILNQKLSETE